MCVMQDVVALNRVPVPLDHVIAVVGLKAKPLNVTLKCEPELSVQLRGTYEDIVPGYHANKKHWITVDLSGSLDDELVRELIASSYDLVA